MINFLEFPSELIEKILCDDCLCYFDICQLALTCSAMASICRNNRIWKCKLNRRWKSLMKRYSPHTTYDWLQEFKKRHLFGLKTNHLVSALSPRYYRKTEISKEGFADFETLSDEDADAAFYILEQLNYIVNSTDKNKNLTNRYYAVKALRHMNHQHLLKEWKSFLDLQPVGHSLENGLILVAKWCQPHILIYESEIEKKIDGLARRVLKEVRETNPLHPLINQGLCKDFSMKETKWSPSQARIILEWISVVLYDHLRFQDSNVELSNPENSYIDKVMENKRGIPIVMCVLYSGIARRLGVICELVNFPTHFILRWREHPYALPNQRYTFIDPFYKGRFMTEGDCHAQEVLLPTSSLLYESVDPLQVLEKMTRKLVSIGRQYGEMGESLTRLRNALELHRLLCTDDIGMLLLWSRVNLHLNINLEEVLEATNWVAELRQQQYQDISNFINLSVARELRNNENAKDEQIIPKKREYYPGVKLSVGLIMRHRRYHYLCVITGWDAQCQASQEWIEQMGVEGLDQKQYQPFYNVLVEDGTNRYAAEENLLFPDKTEIVEHPDVGKYFEAYQGDYYFPNNEKRSEYPDDVEKTKNLIEENCQSS